MSERKKHVWKKQECVREGRPPTPPTAGVVPFGSKILHLPLRVKGIQGYLAHKNPPPPEDYHRTLGIVLL